MRGAIGITHTNLRKRNTHITQQTRMTNEQTCEQTHKPSDAHETQHDIPSVKDAHAPRPHREPPPPQASRSLNAAEDYSSGRKVAAGTMLCAALIASSVAELAALSGLSL